jgi:glycosyltransferase involved in cell wall biosynthesis
VGYAIVTIGYNRVNSLKRLINSLLNAEYLNDKVDLIISIDNSGTNAVEEYAKKVSWPFGNKTIKTYPERMGLRKHVLACGDYVYGYDAIAVLEDDIFVAPTFYSFMKQAVEFYKEDENIAGISLYSHLWSENNRRPFVPEKKKYDNYFLQYAQSWGQVWMPRQWQAFRDWYMKNDGEIKPDENTPEAIVNWPKTSWLKYHIKYCIEKNKYFVYPYMSYTTNFVEIGEHCRTSNTVYQVPMVYDAAGDYRFARFGAEDVAYYDAFFERIISADVFNDIDGEVEVDLYGNKPIKASAKYLLTSKRLTKLALRKYGLQLRPHEMNVFQNIPGNDLFLYDLSKESTEPTAFSDFVMARWYYDSRVFEYPYIIKVLWRLIKSQILKR